MVSSVLQLTLSSLTETVTKNSDIRPPRSRTCCRGLIASPKRPSEAQRTLSPTARLREGFAFKERSVFTIDVIMCHRELETCLAFAAAV
ncbi:hypothetical protein CB1_000568009 [Camelus ferus]|nr:hypothetical protein CB1_000568009 [Camelus ferus]